jgi:ribonuclease BN (tRNA processing enzyme)
MDYMNRSQEIANKLRRKGILSRLREAETEINKHLKPCSKKLLKNDCFYVLRRWNSYTPALRTEDVNSLGGGYFLLWKGKGVVIDPGFDFIKNFHNAGFSVGCIDALVVTHSHLDHCADFESLLTLVFEYNDQRIKEAKEKQGATAPQIKLLSVYASLGTLKKCSGWLEFFQSTRPDPYGISRIYALNSQPGECGFPVPGTEITLRPTYAEHHEIIASGYSVGLVVDLYEGQNKEASIGFTSDTAWTPEIQKQYDQCNLLVMHIGTVDEKELTEYKTYSKHLGALGVSQLISEMRQDCQLYLFSEFGEEFRESRREIMTTIKSASPVPERCIIADIGTKVRLPHMELICEYTGCTEGAETEDIFDYFGIVRHYCKKHRPYKSHWAQLDD